MISHGANGCRGAAGHLADARVRIIMAVGRHIAVILSNSRILDIAGALSISVSLSIGSREGTKGLSQAESQILAGDRGGSGVRGGTRDLSGSNSVTGGGLGSFSSASGTRLGSSSSASRLSLAGTGDTASRLGLHFTLLVGWFALVHVTLAGVALVDIAVVDIAVVEVAMVEDVRIESEKILTLIFQELSIFFFSRNPDTVFF